MNITLTMKQQKRIEIMERALRNDLTVIEAALVLGVSERQCYRIKARVKDQGVKGVIHGNRGRPCKYKVKDQTLKRVVELARGKYRGFNDHHLSEKLKEEEKIEMSREKVRRVLRSHGIGSPRKRRANKHRSRRERREAEGMMLQLDGSPHDWLEGRGAPLTLVGAIDDATSKVPMAFFEEAETSWAYFHLFNEIFKKDGLPHSVYSDRHSIFWTDREPTLAEQLQGKRPTTEVGRALEELGITLIPAGSPQAKGRIERLWGTLQDRLVSELRLAGAKTRTEAQAVLERYLPKFNRTFSITARKTQPAWRKVQAHQLKNSLCFKYSRTVAKDHTVNFEGVLFQIPKKSPSRSYAGKRINVHVLLDGLSRVLLQRTKNSPL
jgi:transposase